MKQYYVYVQRSKAQTVKSLSQALIEARTMAANWMCNVTVANENGVIGVVEPPRISRSGKVMNPKFIKI